MSCNTMAKDKSEKKKDPSREEEKEEEERKRSKVGDFLYAYPGRHERRGFPPSPCRILADASHSSKETYEKGELALKHAAGLGQQPSVVPVGQPKVNGKPRVVEVGWHPVGGVAGKWFAEDTGLGKMITDRINKYPDPTQHWAILVGDYAHQLWMVRAPITVQD